MKDLHTVVNATLNGAALRVIALKVIEDNAGMNGIPVGLRTYHHIEIDTGLTINEATFKITRMKTVSPRGGIEAKTFRKSQIVQKLQVMTTRYNGLV